MPEDVRQGQIFYNNKGRQVGTGNMLPVDIKSLIFTAQKDNDSFSKYYSSLKADMYVMSDYGILGITLGSNASFLNLYNSVNIKYTSIMGLKIDGKFYPVSIPYNDINYNPKIVNFGMNNKIPCLLFFDSIVYSLIIQGEADNKEEMNIEIFYY